MCQKANQDLRQLMTELGVFRYSVAEKCGVATSTLVAWLQRPLEENRRKRILEAIHEAAAESDR